MTIQNFTADELAGTSVGVDHGAAMTRLNAMITQMNANNVVDVVMAVADAGGGATAALLTADAKEMNGVASAKVSTFLILAADTQYAGKQDQNANVTFGTATKGSILASGAGWAVVKTDATGSFACTATNTADEAVYFNATSVDGGVDSVGYGTVVRGCVPDLATWSA
jgi:hypothetical protein